MWPRKKLDIGFCDLLRGLSYALSCSIRAIVSSENRRQPENENASRRFVCLSVRSGFDTLLRSLNLPTGSEVLFSELTIADMGRIASANGMQPVGVGLDGETWSMDLALLESSITPQTRAIVVAQLFGRRDSLVEIAKIAKRHGLLLIEDCAQSFRGPHDHGDSAADVSMFSFGPIKTNTCLAGAVFHFRRHTLVESFADQLQQLPKQSDGSFAKRLCKYFILKCFNGPVVYGMLYRSLILFGCDPDLTISGLARGFAGSDFLRRIRKRPCSALVRLIESRLNNYDAQRLHERSALGRELTSLLSPAIETPAHSTEAGGGGDVDVGYWVYPVLSRHPESLKAELVQNGFDATQRSSFVLIANRSGEETAGQQFLNRVVFLPLENDMSLQDIRRLAEIVNSHEQRWLEDDVARSKSPSGAERLMDQAAKEPLESDVEV